MDGTPGGRHMSVPSSRDPRVKCVCPRGNCGSLMHVSPLWRDRHRRVPACCCRLQECLFIQLRVMHHSPCAKHCSKRLINIHSVASSKLFERERPLTVLIQSRRNWSPERLKHLPKVPQLFKAGIETSACDPRSVLLLTSGCQPHLSSMLLGLPGSQIS